MKAEDVKTAVSIEVEANGAQGLDQLARAVSFLREMRTLGYAVETDGYINVKVRRASFAPAPEQDGDKR